MKNYRKPWIGLAAILLIACGDDEGVSPIDSGDYAVTLRCDGEEASLTVSVHIDWDKSFHPVTIEREGDPRTFGILLKNEAGEYDTDSRIEFHYQGPLDGEDGRSALLRFVGDCASSGDDYECGGECFGAAVSDESEGQAPPGRAIDDSEATLFLRKRS